MNSTGSSSTAAAAGRLRSRAGRHRLDRRRRLPHPYRRRRARARSSRPRTTSRCCATTRPSSRTARDVHVWEVAGTSHADAFVAGPALRAVATAIRGSTRARRSSSCRAAISALDRWVRTGPGARVSAPVATRRRGAAPRRLRDRARRHPHAAGRRPGRGAVRRGRRPAARHLRGSTAAAAPSRRPC